MNAAEFAMFQAGVMAGLLAADRIKNLLSANEGNLDLTLRIRNYSLLNTYTAQAVGDIIPGDSSSKDGAAPNHAKTQPGPR